MMFYTLLISFMLIGTSFADLQLQLLSCQYINDHLIQYCTGLSHKFQKREIVRMPEFVEIQGTLADQLRKAYQQVVNDALGQHTSADALPDRPPGQVLIHWMGKASSLVVQCAQAAKVNENINEVFARSLLIQETSSLMTNINEELFIAPEYKKAKCPIYHRIKQVIRDYGHQTELQWFENQNESEAGPST